MLEKEEIQSSSGNEKEMLDKTMNILKKAGKVLKIFRYGKELVIEFGKEINMIQGV